MTQPELGARLSEFRDFVWNHAEDEFQAKFDLRAALTNPEIEQLKRLLTSERLLNLDALAQEIRRQVCSPRSCLRLLLQMTGLTRNKILQDIKAHARNHNLPISTSKPHTLFNSESGSLLASEYLARQIQRVFGPTAGRIDATLLETVNQATWPGFIRQERAKRQGHEAEYRIACVLRNCGLSFVPEEKAENPLCRDVQVDGVSYDIITPSVEQAWLRVKATVHTANIGQYGESKDDLEIREAAESIEKSKDRDRITLLAFIDGVGFESNKAGLHGVLNRAHEFCQFRTMWKTALIAASKVGCPAVVALPPEQHDRFRAFCKRFSATMEPLDATRTVDAGWVTAGDGRVKITRTGRDSRRS